MLICVALLVALFSISKNRRVDCFDWWTEAKPNQRGGFNHLLHLESDCEHALHCEISTDANTVLGVITIPARSNMVINTFRGAPTEDFTADVRCEKQ